MTIKLALVGVVVAGLFAPISVAPISASGTRAHSCALNSAQRSGGISEMVSCGNWGVKGNRSQFVSAINRPVEGRAFLSQLAH